MRYNAVSFLQGKLEKFWIGLIFVLLINFAFKFLFTPSLDNMGPYSLINAPEWMDSLKKILSTDPLAILFPVQYAGTDGKILWWTTTIVPFYFISQVLSPFGVYIATSSLLIITTYLCSWFIRSSFTFSCTLGILFALGTQLNYALTYGVLLTLYILLSYSAINITLCIYILRAKTVSFHHYFLFFISLMLCMLGSEYWLNFGVSLILGLGFLICWAIHNEDSTVKKRSIIMIAIALIMLALYLLEERHSAHKYFEAGVEEELIFTYSNILLMLDDIIVNYFTLLYISLSNYLPSFFFFSNSATYLGEARILAEQHGYHAQKTHLVMASHLFAWRFYAGILTTIFFIMGWKWFRSCWQEKANLRSLVLFVLWIAVASGFATHLVIKMRPYNSTPMLGYKAIFSSFSFTILIAYFITTSQDYFKKIYHWHAMIVSIWLIVLLAAFTRPSALNAGLAATGLVGYSDPAAQLKHGANKMKTLLFSHQQVH